MTKRKDVIKALECCKDINKLNCDDCPYTYNARSDRCECTAEMAFDALELLKEQEPVKPIKPRGSASWICGACKIAIGTSLIYRFCPWCGAEAKQDD